ncbi:MAG TPA: hypothetical protein ENK05_12810 [Gammaproteobacteria bacterium]|nr:hypothetical protein [Gammaproteobacteria bacterium]
MNTKQWTAVSIVSFLSFGTVQTLADSSWYYDEEGDTIVYNIDGSRCNYDPSAPSAGDGAVTTGAWHYDEESDTIVYDIEGSRVHYARTGVPDEKIVAHGGGWHYDESGDTIIYDVDGSRLGYTAAGQGGNKLFHARQLARKHC